MDVLCRRTFTGHATHETFEVIVYHPKMISADEWTCHVDIASANHTDKVDVSGVDALQVIALSGDHIRTRLIELSPELTWNDMSIEMAFPESIPMYLGREFYNEVKVDIDRRLQEYVEKGSRDE